MAQRPLETKDTGNWAGGNASATVICSDCSRNGKTLFAKLVADLLQLRKGAPPYIFDTDDPDGVLLHHFPGAGEVVNILRTDAQLAVFDGMLGVSKPHFLIDLSARHFTRFFDIFRNIDFEEGAIDAGLDVTVFFLIDRSASSVAAASKLRHSIPKTRFIPVRNGAIGDSLSTGNTADIYQNMHFDREILLPALSDDALAMLEHANFHFDAFLAGRCDHFSFELKSELWGFMESLYEQRTSIDTGTTDPV